MWRSKKSRLFGEYRRGCNMTGLAPGFKRTCIGATLTGGASPNASRNVHSTMKKRAKLCVTAERQPKTPCDLDFFSK